MSKLMRKMAMVLAGTLMVEASIPAAAIYAHETVTVKAQGKETTKDTSAKGDLSTTIRFDSPIAYKKVKQQDIKVTLKKGTTSIVEIQLGATPKIVKNTNNYPVEIVAQNTEGIEITTEEVIGSYYINVKNLEIGDYDLEYQGKGYKTYTVDDIELKDYSKNVMVGTGDGTFSDGDINRDGLITEEDLKAIEDQVRKNEHEGDINGDGKVDITELTYVKHQLQIEQEGKGQAIQTDLAAIISENIIKATEAAIEKANLEIVGEKSIADLFTPKNESSSSDSGVEIKRTSTEGEFVIPLELGEEGVEAQTIEFVSPGGNGGLEKGKVLVEYYLEDGTTDTIEEAFDNSIESAQVLSRIDEKKTVVINLGKRVPVKSVKISVDKVVGETGEPTYVVMEQVSFVKDIVSNVSPVDKTMVKNVKATAKDKEVVLTWDAVPNVEGYKVVYGEKSGDYTKELNVDTNSATVEGLENLKTYYFRVKAISGDWEGTESDECQATPQPSKAPLKPDFLKVQEMNGGITLSWGKAEDATYYRVFYKKATDETYNEFIPQGATNGKIKGLSATIGGLENTVKYELYVISGNDIGESGRSLIVEGTPKKEEVEGPILPTKNKISMDQIKNIVMTEPGNIDWSQYPNGFNTQYVPNSTEDGIKNIVDGDYATHWTAQANQYWRSEEMTYTFEEPIEMNYLIYVDRMDRNYTQNWNYTITIWEDEESLSGPGKKIVDIGYTKRKVDKNGQEYYIVEFPKHMVKRMSLQVEQASYSSISEIVFYEYDSLADDIAKLFKDESFTQLAEGIEQSDITALRERLNAEDTYHAESAIFKEELDLAEALLNKDNSKLGIMREDLVSIDASSDLKKINDWSPLGIVGFAGKQMVVYADIPQGEKVELIPTQYYSEASTLAGSVIELSPGRNVIDIAKIGNLKETAGGAFYYRYSGQQGDKIKLHIKGFNNSVVEIPTLELYNWQTLSEVERKEKIGQYIDQLTAYKPESLGNKETNPANSTEISGRNVLLSLPADQVLIGLKGVNASREEQIQKLYDNMLAWEEVTEVVHTTYGLDNPVKVLKSRQNIRYMRMFGKAFMYAAGSHIGVGYGSTSALVQGKPTALLGDAAENGLFGWGIGHEIGHNMDRIGKTEITNNIYSLMLQTYDGKDNILQSRLELSNKYEEIYKKVAIGDKGMANDVFTQLGMYWQLHLAYDNGQADTNNGPLNFYNQLFKVYDSGKVKAFSGDNQFAVAASMVAGKNLTEFFTKWGMDLSDAAKKAMAEYPVEERKIQYITDESRRYRLNGGQGIANMDFTATASVVGKVKASTTEETNDNKVKITIEVDEAYKKDLLGFEIFREGEQIAFITGTTYEDVLGSANNKAFKYEVRAIDVLGNVINKDVNEGKVDAGQVRIEHDNVIDSSKYGIQFVKAGSEVTTGSALTTTGPAIVITFKEEMPVTGIRVKAKSGSTLPEGTFTIQVDRQGKLGIEYATIKQGNFSQNAAVDTSKFITYFNKPGVSSEDTRIWTYDANVICITGENIDESFLEQFDVEPLGYPGDNVAFEDYKMGIMGQDYTYDTEGGTETIKEGTLVVLGSYRGDPLYNTIHIEGKFAEHTGLDEKVSYVERPINGEVLMFAEVPEDGETSDISDGFFIFIPDIQAEGELQGHCSDVSVLPTEIMAKMYRYDNVDHTGTPRITSTTLWYTTPSYESMPKIILNQGETLSVQVG